jgi:asparagine synthase (glutamine-hydrolysing)
VKLTQLEIAAGMPLPGAAEAGVKPPGAPSGTPLGALRDAVREALARPPCLVSFSGGIDSSVVLAVAAEVAGREGLPAPVPVTWRFTDAPRAQESAWQERVLADLRVGDWVRLTATDELDFTGPTAVEVLVRHGLMWPPNAFFHAPLIARAAGGSLLTGVGGDQLTVLWHPRWRALADARAQRRRPVPRDAARLLAAHAPTTARRLLERHRAEPPSPWLTARAARQVARALLGERAENPVRYERYLAWMARRRIVAMQRESLERLGRDHDVEVTSPLLDVRFLAALAGDGGRDGFGGRTPALRQVLGALWPAALDRRRDKATFDEVFWRAPSRQLARAWDGEAVDRALVDRGALRRAWLAPRPDLRSALLLQRLALQRTPTHAKPRE